MTVKIAEIAKADYVIDAINSQVKHTNFIGSDQHLLDQGMFSLEQNGMDQHWIDEQIDAVQSFATERGNCSSDSANEIKHGKLSIYSSSIYQKLF